LNVHRQGDRESIVQTTRQSHPACCYLLGDIAGDNGDSAAMVGHASSCVLAAPGSRIPFPELATPVARARQGPRKLWSVITIIITALAFMCALDCVHIVTTTIITTIIIDKKKGQPSSECPFKLLYCGSRGRAGNAVPVLCGVG
jgi:hypothetical protein